MLKIRKFLILIMLLIYEPCFSSEISILENKIFKNLRCLVCQGQSISDSNSDFAQTLKSVVRDKINEGRNEVEIYEFLANKYGEWIVYKPAFNKTNFILWLIPYFFLIFGVFFIYRTLKK